MDGTAGAGSGLVAGDGPDPVVHSLDETPSGCLVAPAPGGAGRRAGLLRSDYTVLLYTRGLGHACGGRKDRRAGMGRHATDDRTARSRRAHTRRVNPLRVNTGDPRSGAIGGNVRSTHPSRGMPGGRRSLECRETPREPQGDAGMSTTAGIPRQRRVHFRDPSAPAATVVVPSVFVVVRGRGGRLLLVRRCDSGTWELPGGRVDIGESAAEAAIRETAEEAAVRVVVTGLVGVFTDPS